ncbi:MAG TPA: hypothetical protein VF916_15175 [Ktedonobacterales bacterium]
MTADLRDDPREHSDWRRHKTGCPNYRERWFPNSNPAAGEPLYQVFCLLNTPPTSFEEQQLCLASRTCCWRLAAAEARPAAHPVERSRGTKRPA